MGQILRGKKAPEYIEGKTNEVVGVTEARTVAVAFTDGEGRKSMCLALIFGEDTGDGGPGIFILADEDQMGDQLKVANKVVKEGVRRWLESAEDGDDLPEHLSSGSVAGAAPTSGVAAVEV